MSKSLHDKIEAIRFEFVQSLPTRMGIIQQLANSLLSEWEHNNASLLMQELHNLKGVSGGHGFMAIHAIAETLETLIQDTDAKADALSFSETAAIQNAVANLINRANHIYDTFETKTDNSSDQPILSNTKTPLILIIDDDKHFCNMLATQLEHLGYRTRSVYDISKVPEKIQAYKPNAIFMDIIFGGNRDAGTQVMSVLQDNDEISCPILYMSARDDLQARLNAVRSGGVAFLCKTFNLGDLKNVVDLIVPLQHDQTYKVLILDDDKIAREYSRTILEHAGIQVICMEKPEKIFEEIINFDPDVILLDMYMPHINGIEMAEIIRQHQNFSAIPIIIMSSETNINKQFKMRSAGADDFILKPFKPHHLADIILNRIKRSKQTKHLIYTDGLTGLMLFTKVKDQIINLLESCLRYNLDFSVVLIDLDHFKIINDTFGHLSGDRILRDFAEFLSARVRRSDIVTRSGGEEFTLIFPYTNAENSLRAINSIREAYAQRVHVIDHTDVKITFSAGISSIDNWQDLQGLLVASDHALYKAKESGRNNAQISN